MITLPVTCNEITTGLKLLGIAVIGWMWYAGIFEQNVLAFAGALSFTIIGSIFGFVFYGDRAHNFITRNIRCKCENDSAR